MSKGWGFVRSCKKVIILALFFVFASILTPSVLWAGGAAGACGRDNFGQLGDGGGYINQPLPVGVLNLSDVISISAGSNHSLAAESDGTAWAWGFNIHGQLGDGTYDDSNIPVQVHNIAGVIAVAGGDGHSLALKSNGTVWAWGSNVSGQIGDGTNEDRDLPVNVLGLTGVVAIAAGGEHSLALKGDGTVWAWGSNLDGQLGDRSTNTESCFPVQVSDLAGVVAIAGGGSHSLALKSDGRVWAWGDNFYGQLGDTTTNGRNYPVQASGLTNAIAIEAGDFHSLAVKSDGTAWAWGNNLKGQLGNNSNSDSHIPVQVMIVTGVVAVSGGGSHSLALKGDGTVYAWGYNFFGQLGNGSNNDSNFPVQMPSIGSVMAIAGGGFHTLGISGTCSMPSSPAITNITDLDDCAQSGITITFTSGTPATRHDLYADGLPAKIGVLSPFVYYANNMSSHNYVIRAVNQLDLCHTDSAPYSFAASSGFPGAPSITGILDLDSAALTGVQIHYNTGAAAIQHDLYMDGVLAEANFISGNNYGPGDSKIHRYKIRAINLCGYTDSAVFLGRDIQMVLPATENMHILAWGQNEDGQLGRGIIGNEWDFWHETRVPGFVKNLTDVRDMAGGAYHSIALSQDGTVWCWGRNYFGQLGIGNDDSNFRSGEPVQTINLTGAIAVGAGEYDSLALKGDGTVWRWGLNYTTNVGGSTPSQMAGLTDVISIAGCFSHSLALKNDGTVWAWGTNTSGELGDGTNNPGDVPVQVVNLTDVVAISGGYHDSLALRSDGTVWAWGLGGMGELGNGANTNSNIPVQVSNLSGVVSIDAGDCHSLALKSDGTVWAWGYNSAGQLGDGTQTNRNLPVQVQNISGAAAVAGGEAFSTAVKQDGTVWSWGINGSGQFGTIYPTTFSKVPVQAHDIEPTGGGLDHLKGITAIAAGKDFAMAIFECVKPAQPVITDVGDTDGCGNVLISFAPISPISPITADWLLIDGNMWWGYNYSSGLGYFTIVMTDVNSHSFVIRASYGYGDGMINDDYEVCFTDSAPYEYADPHGFSGPELASVVDIDAYALTGVRIIFNPSVPSSRHDLYMDGSLVQTGFVSGTIFLPGDTNTHTYVIRGINGACYKNSLEVQAKDENKPIPPAPPEIATGASSINAQMWDEAKATQSWPYCGSATGYRLYRGVQADLQNLDNASTDFCTRYDGASTGIDLSADDPSSAAGRCYFYLVTAYNGPSEGIAGSSTQGTRYLNTTGSCP
jgi:alpha-tubulin suppressor-like RCC1 family protein